MKTTTASIVTCSMAALMVVLAAIGVEERIPYIAASSILGAGIMAGCCNCYDKRPKSN